MKRGTQGLGLALAPGLRAGDDQTFNLMNNATVREITDDVYQQAFDEGMRKGRSIQGRNGGQHAGRRLVSDAGAARESYQSVWKSFPSIANSLDASLTALQGKISGVLDQGNGIPFVGNVRGPMTPARLSTPFRKRFMMLSPIFLVLRFRVTAIFAAPSLRRLGAHPAILASPATSTSPILTPSMTALIIRASSSRCC